METKKHLLAQKKVTGAVSTFDKAAIEIDKAIVLIEESIGSDKKRLFDIEEQVKSLETSHDHVQANIISKQAEIKRHIELSLKLKEFTIGGI